MLKIKRGHRRNYKFLRGFTLLELLVVVLILGILAGVVTPMFRKAIRRAEYKEVKTIVELTRAGADYYNVKYGIEIFQVATATQSALWNALNVEEPSGAKCEYRIEMDGLNKKLVVYSPPISAGGTWIYKYDLENKTAESNSAHPDVEYLPDDLP